MDGYTLELQSPHDVDMLKYAAMRGRSLATRMRDLRARELLAAALKSEAASPLNQAAFIGAYHAANAEPFKRS